MPRSRHLLLIAVAALAGSVFAAPVAAADRANGLAMNVYRIGKSLSRIPELRAGEKPNVAKVIATLDLDKKQKDFGVDDHFTVTIDGFIAISGSGKYRFRVTSDDGCRLSINGAVVVDADGLRAGEARDGEVFLKKGLHPIRIEYFENNGAAYLRVDWRPPRVREYGEIPATRLFHDPAQLLQTAPGNKRVHSQKMEHDARLRRDQKVLKAIDAGVAYLLKMIDKEQIGSPQANNNVGQVAFETYALLAAGVSVDHAAMVANLDYVEENVYKPGNTYASALDAAIAQAEYDYAITNPDSAARVIADGRLGKKYAKRIKKVTEVLLSGQNATGGWRYLPTDAVADASCTQFAALALGIAAKRRAKVPLQAWQRLADYFIDGQEASGPRVALQVTPMDEPGTYKDRLDREDQDESGEKIDPADDTGDGAEKEQGGTGVRGKRPEPLLPEEELEVMARGFKYMPDRDATWSMTCAGVSTLLLVHDQIGHRVNAKSNARLRKSLRDALGWLQRHWGPTSHYYYGMYSLEKVGDLGRIRDVGDHDWYLQLSSHLLLQQDRDGSWPGTGHHGENHRVTTSFALLVLGRATSMLTRKNPTEQIIVTGGESVTRDGVGSSEWVYVPDLDTRVYLPGILRAVRLRPNVQLVQLLEKVCRSYPEKETPELIPDLLLARGRVTVRSVKKVLRECLTLVSGQKLKTDEQFLELFTDWERIRQIGSLREEQHGAELIALHDKYLKNQILLRAALEAIGQLRVVDATSLLLTDMGHSRKVIRSAAYAALRAIHMEGVPPFDAEASPKERGRQIAAIQAWLDERG